MSLFKTPITEVLFTSDPNIFKVLNNKAVISENLFDEILVN